jgi:hypothetical protein
MRLVQDMRSGSGTVAAVNSTDAIYMEYSANDKPRHRLLGDLQPRKLRAYYLRCVGSVGLRNDIEMRRHNRLSQP